mgnify:CR=1 FL=1|tara:strand:+ start:371494 stop:372072 length:579 start_codon:yes stop_codon:yes gene_type:complete
MITNTLKMKVISVNIGERTKVQWRKKIVETGIFKYPVSTPVFLNTEVVTNDTIVDRVHHGGPLQAVYAFGEQHYAEFKVLYPDLDWNYGMFGENLTVSGLNEENIHVGSIYQLGNAKIEVTKPRQPCYKLGIRFQDQTIVKQIWNSTKCGVYFKVLETGNVAKNDTFILLENKPANPTIADVYTSKRIQKGM